jgi:hypothetical protein
VIFRFRRYDVQPTPGYPSGVIYRPVVPIRVGAVGGPRLPFFGLLDTGSDDTKLTVSAAKRLGVTLDYAHPVLYRGVGGVTVGYFADMVLELRQSPKSYRWRARIAFLPDPADVTTEERITLTLGHTGFFRHFHADFDYQRGRVKLKPNRLFVGLPKD